MNLVTYLSGIFRICTSRVHGVPITIGPIDAHIVTPLNADSAPPVPLFALGLALVTLMLLWWFASVAHFGEFRMHRFANLAQPLQLIRHLHWLLRMRLLLLTAPWWFRISLVW